MWKVPGLWEGLQARLLGEAAMAWTTSSQHLLQRRTQDGASWGSWGSFHMKTGKVCLDHSNLLLALDSSWRLVSQAMVVSGFRGKSRYQTSRGQVWAESFLRAGHPGQPRKCAEVRPKVLPNSSGQRSSTQSLGRSPCLRQCRQSLEVPPG